MEGEETGKHLRVISSSSENLETKVAQEVSEELLERLNTRSEGPPPRPGRDLHHRPISLGPACEKDEAEEGEHHEQGAQDARALLVAGQFERI
jgi:hypothetical protein